MEGSRAATAPGGEVDVSRELEMRLGISLDGAKAADWAAVYSTSNYVPVSLSFLLPS